MDYLKQANEAVNRIAKSEGPYKELEQEIKYYKALLAVNDEKDNDNTQEKIEETKYENDSKDYRLRCSICLKAKIATNKTAATGQMIQVRSQALT